MSKDTKERVIASVIILCATSVVITAVLILTEADRCLLVK